MSLASIALAAACIEAAEREASPLGDGKNLIDPERHHSGDTNLISASISPKSTLASTTTIEFMGMDSLPPPPLTISHPQAACRLVSYTDEDITPIQPNNSYDQESDDSDKILAVKSVSCASSTQTSSSSIVVSENDVLCGRGGETNHHPGNVRYRTLVKSMQREYLDAKRRDKPRIARKIVDTISAMNPPGRFLKRDSKGCWNEIGINKAREKTSQALREGAPEIRDIYQGASLNATSETHPVHSESVQQSVNIVSSEDETSCSSTPAKSKKAKRGPRLFVLKSRMTEGAKESSCLAPFSKRQRTTAM
mmetsp:Transcript_25214/g.37135  ORF Transcript_25214/g.37135 Transcript_25214/m.37135 type:complete len:308 (+) Transcript_25214:94-1017(+)|eukprot:CAMPEP_0195537764 /NCGR_PEP_ID=MMETSP0794_2-20130614/48595_1 /TAXON_ID=515487 /ORGANISM="Stephanopyxis turris, Strain CCMP 815" /LENGTH=307 /DNA_ID=CAMNT_0040671579 /DNA_START=83 /DNA_END=1006 /DNA_ORIENTATION=+